jgi:translation initiation factor 2B subunit (eIF-2B alpha/beta/delta family)
MREGEDLFERVKEIERDQERGALELTLDAVMILHAAGISISDRNIHQELCMDLLKIKPNMAPMINLVNGALLALDNDGSLERFCSDFATHISDNKEKVARNGAELIENGFRVMTYSNSSTIIETLKRAVDDGKEFDVVLSEARPVREGILMARTLKNLGISITMVADSALFQEMEDVNIVMVGADSLSSQYLINKIGTRGLAAQSRLVGKEMIAIAGSEKIIPSEIDNYRKDRRPPEQIATGDEGFKVVNYYFDQTPLHLITKIVTEKGTVGPFEIIRQAKELTLHPVVKEFFMG